MINQDFTPKPFWRFGIAVTAVSLMTACGSQTLTENPETTASYNATDSSASVQQDASYQADEDELIGYGLITPVTSDQEIIEKDNIESRASDENDALLISDSSKQPSTPKLEEDADMTVLVLDEATMTALEAQYGENTKQQENIHPDQDADAMTTIEPPQPRIIYYGFDQAELDAAQKAEIRQHANFLAVHPDYQIQLHGHTDKQGHPTYNEKLARQRAQLVADALIDAGVNPEQIEIFAWGSRDPLLSASQHDKNRRVEMIYLNDQVAFGQANPPITMMKQEARFVD